MFHKTFYFFITLLRYNLQTINRTRCKHTIH
jgi:hypothetical protein